jgi:hypothetical protein
MSDANDVCNGTTGAAVEATARSNTADFESDEELRELSSSNSSLMVVDSDANRFVFLRGTISSSSSPNIFT